MPRKKSSRPNKKRQGGSRATHSQQQKYQVAQDISIHEYADATNPTERVRKVNTVAAPESIAEVWEPEPEPGDLEGGRRRRRRRRAAEAAGGGGGGGEYPEVVWYHISRYVRPEDVGRFAAINRAAYAASRREAFWRRLYAVWCEPRRRLLPPELRAGGGGVAHALRQRVVRALHYTYPLFVRKTAAAEQEEGSARALVGRRCVNVWYDKSEEHWRYAVKLRDAAPRDTSGWLGRRADVDANAEERCRALLVTCEECSALPPVMGLRLHGAAAALAAGGGLRLRRLRLEFSAPPAPDTTLLLERVRRVLVLDWWHPRYPHAAVSTSCSSAAASPAAGHPPPPDPADALTPPLLATDFFLS